MTTAPACLVSSVTRWSQNAPASTCNFAGETRKTSETKVPIALNARKCFFLSRGQVRFFCMPLKGIGWSQWSLGLTYINKAFFGAGCDQSRPKTRSRDQKLAPAGNT